MIGKSAGVNDCVPPHPDGIAPVMPETTLAILYDTPNGALIRGR